MKDIIVYSLVLNLWDSSLGLAFLTMLASCLMFKILSGSKSDIARYEMLEKIGTRRGLLKQSIRREVGCYS